MIVTELGARQTELELDHFHSAPSNWGFPMVFRPTPGRAECMVIARLQVHEDLQQGHQWLLEKEAADAKEAPSSLAKPVVATVVG